MTSRVDQIADELYGLHPGAFTVTRNERAGEAVDAGDRLSAKAIRKLRRPSTSAWLTNMLQRERPDEMAELAELGEALRAAQATLTGSDLRQLAGQRRRFVDRVIPIARTLAADLGHPAGDSVLKELQGTLQAALIDPDVAAAVAQGHLSVALRAETSFGFVAAPSPPAEATGTAPASLELARARREVDRAVSAVEAAERTVAERRRGVAAADDALTRTTAQVDELTEALHRANAEKAAAERLATSAHETCELATRQVDEARQLAAQARADLDEARRTSTAE